MLAREVPPHSPHDDVVRVDGGRATRGAIGASSVGHQGESRRTRSSAAMEDATHVMAWAVLSEPCAARDHESFTGQTRAGSADGLRKRRTRRSRHLTGACSRGDENDTWDPRIRCSRRTPFVRAWKPWRGARRSVSDRRAFHRAPSPCASERTPGSGSPGSEPLSDASSSERVRRSGGTDRACVNDHHHLGT